MNVGENMQKHSKKIMSASAAVYLKQAPLKIMFGIQYFSIIVFELKSQHKHWARFPINKDF